MHIICFYITYLLLFVLPYNTIAVDKSSPGHNSNGQNRKDPYEEIIENTLQLTGRQLLIYCYNSFAEARSIIINGLSELAKILPKTPEDTKNELVELCISIKRGLDLAAEINKDLEYVFPELPNSSTEPVTKPLDNEGTSNESVIPSTSETLAAYLGMTLEEFIVKIRNTTQIYYNAVWTAYKQFRGMMENSGPKLGSKLFNIASYMNHATAIIEPLLYDLNKIL